MVNYTNLEKGAKDFPVITEDEARSVLVRLTSDKKRDLINKFMEGKYIAKDGSLNYGLIMKEGSRVILDTEDAMHTLTTKSAYFILERERDEKKFSFLKCVSDFQIEDNEESDVEGILGYKHMIVLLFTDKEKADAAVENFRRETDEVEFMTCRLPICAALDEYAGCLADVDIEDCVGWLLFVNGFKTDGSDEKEIETKTCGRDNMLFMVEYDEAKVLSSLLLGDAENYAIFDVVSQREQWIDDDDMDEDDALFDDDDDVDMWPVMHSCDNNLIKFKS